MHNLDRTLFESGEYESEAGPQHEQEDFLGILGSLLGGSGGSGESGAAEFGELHEAGELEAAAELLEVRDEAELEQFLGSLLKKAAGAASNFVRSPTGQALGGILGRAAKAALPVVGRSIGGWLSPDFAGGGERVGRAAGDLLGLELEGLSSEDREFESARAFVRFADAAARNAAACGPRPGAAPATVARQAAVAAARDHAPGLVNALGGGAPANDRGAAAGTRARGGRWYRRGNAIVIFNA